MLRRLRSLLRALTARPTFEDGMAQELQSHLEHYAQDLIRSGLSPAEAHRRARIEFGGLNSVKENCRQSRGLQPFDELRRTVLYAGRLLRKTPAFTITALLTVALCLSANLAIFAVIDAILVRPLPFPSAARLVTIFNTYPKAGVDRDGASITNYYERRGHIPGFSSISIYALGTAITGAPGARTRSQITRISPEFFTTLGVAPILGRAFSDAEMNNQNNSVAIVSDAYWHEHFHADPHVLGQTLWVDTIPKTVVGVLPPNFHFLSSKSGLYLPLSSSAEQRQPKERQSGGNVIQMVARLRRDVTLAAAQSQVDTQNTALERDDPQGKMMADAGFRSLVVSLHGDQVAAIRPILLLLQAGVLALLLIGLVNLINLLLVRASARVKEVAVRRALGASTIRIGLETLVETVLLTLSGSLLSLPLAAAGIHLLATLGADRLPLGGYVTFDARTAFVALAIALLLGLALAAPVTWFHLRPPLEEALQTESRTGTAGRAAQLLRHGFVTAQIALAFVLLTGAVLLGVSLGHVMSVSPGFESNHTVAGQLSFVGEHYASSPQTAVQFNNRLAAALHAYPGVVAVGFATNIPFSGNNGKSAAVVEGYTPHPGEPPHGYYSVGVSGDYFTAMGLPLRAGRFLTADDSARNIRTCVVDGDFARRNWPHSNPLGQHVFQGSEPGKPEEAFTVVGVVGPIKQAGLTDDTAQGTVYYPFPFRADVNSFVALRGSLPSNRLATVLAQSVRQLDPDLAVNEVQSMDDRISASLLDRRAPALLSGIFSAIALLLITVGTYGVLSYAVAQQRRNIAIRMALGAPPRTIQRHFFSVAVRLLGSGMVLGILGIWATSRALMSVLFHVAPADPLVLATSSAVIATVGIAACLLPASRSAKVSPLQALA